jgi:fatty acid desaturase
MTIDRRDYELEHAKYLGWERDSFNRLYYGLWIMFLGGFVLSLHVSIGKHFWPTYILIVLFRVLAVTGTGVNFLMQYQAIENLSSIRENIYFRAMGNEARADETKNQAREAHRIVSSSEWSLLAIAGAFLFVAFVGSFLVTLP